MKCGIPVAAIVSAEDLSRLTTLEQQRAMRFDVLDEIQAKNQDVDPQELEAVVAEEIAATRNARQAYLQSSTVVRCARYALYVYAFAICAQSSRGRIP